MNEVNELYQIIGRLYVDMLRTNAVNKQLQSANQMQGAKEKKLQELKELERDQ